MLVYATRRGVNGFTFDPAIGEFTLSHPNLQRPPSGTCYSVNHGNYFEIDAAVQNHISSCQQKGYSQRYTGSMVADIHRNLLKGGIFLYPGARKNPNGKLRLVYECNPFAFIVKIAGVMPAMAKKVS